MLRCHERTDRCSQRRAAQHAESEASKGADAAAMPSADLEVGDLRKWNVVA
jgi:hypothetical protein